MRQRFGRIILPLALLAGAVPRPALAVTIPQADINTVAQRLNAEAPSCSQVSSQVSSVLSTPVGQGWTGDSPVEWDRAGWLVRAYGCGQGSSAVHDRLRAALDWAEPRTPFDNCNWSTFNCWWVDQGINQSLGPAVLFGGGSVASDLKPRVDNDYRRFWNKARRSESGADAIWAAFNNLYGALYFGDQDRLQTVLSLAHASTTYGFGGQIRQDSSYFYHWDKLNQTYGASNARETAHYIKLAFGTALDISQPAKDAFYEWFKNWNQWTTYKGFSDPLTMSKTPYSNRGYQVVGGVDYLLAVNDPRYSSYGTVLSRIKNGAGDPVGALSYPLDSYLVTRRPGFFAGIKLVSLADPNMEASSFAPLLGAVNVLTPANVNEKVSGSEVLQHPHQALGLVTTNAGMESQMYSNGNANFIGNRPPVANWGWYGVSTLEGYHAVAAEKLSWSLSGGQLVLQKAWFVFDDEILSTATGSTTDAGGAQTWLLSFKANSNSAQTSTGAKTLPTSNGSTSSLGSPTWVETNGMGYAFLRGETVKAKAVQDGYTRIYADHGSSFSSAVALLPGKGATFMQSYPANAVDIVQLDSAAHVVRDRSTGIVGAAVFSSVSRTEIGLDKPGYVLYRAGSNGSLSLFNPHVRSDRLGNSSLGQGYNPKFDAYVNGPIVTGYQLSVPFEIRKGGSCTGCGSFQVSYDAGTGRSTLTVNLPENQKFELKMSGADVVLAGIGLNDTVLSFTAPPPPSNQPPIAQAAATPSSGVAPLSVQLSSSGSADPDGSISGYGWTFGDGGTSTAANPSHVFSAAGVYTVTLTVTDNQGATGTDQVTVSVTPALPCTPGASCTTGQGCAGTYDGACICQDVPGDACPVPQDQTPPARPRNLRIAAASQPSCPVVESVVVPSDGQAVISNLVLASGRTYRLEASGTYQYWYPAEPGALADAEWAETSALGAPGWTNPPGGAFELLVNDADGDWGAHDPGHLYTREIVGNGAAVSFRIADDYYPDNQGSLSVDIRECQAPDPTPPSCTVVDSLTVPSDGSAVASSLALESGKTYRIRASGTYHYWHPAEPGAVADAEFAETTALGAPGWTDAPASAFELMVNGEDGGWGPYDASHVYTREIVGSGAPVSFRIEDDYYGDNQGSLSVEIEDCPTVAAPSLSPASGSFVGSVSVSLSTTTPTATIRYTTNGTDPTAASTAYTAPITLTASAIVKARAFRSGYLSSPVTAGSFTVALATVATPTITPAGGTFVDPVSVSIATATSGAALRYTTDGSDPTAASTAYTTPFTLSASATVKARAFKPGFADSDVGTATFTAAPRAATPTISPNGGPFVGTVSVSLATTTSGATIRYTTDGSSPTTASPAYSAPFTLAGNGTVKARAYKAGFTDSDVASASFTITLKVGTPAISPNGGSFTGSVVVTLTPVTKGATIRYTTDGSDPTAASPAYNGPFTLSSSAVVKARGFRAGFVDSDVASASFTVTPNASGVDLVATSLTWSPNPAQQNDSVGVTFTITNAGSQSAGTFHVQLTRNGSYMCDWIIPSLAPAGTFQRTCSGFYGIPSATAPGHTVAMHVDDRGEVVEPDESNNIRSQFIPVSPLSLVSPNGGEAFPAGSLQQIRWSSSLGSDAQVELAYDDGTAATPIATLPAAQAAYVWTVPKTAGATGRIVITGRAGGTAVTDSSDGAFSITAPAPPPPPVDFDGDGKADLLWQHRVRGDLYAWLMDGTQAARGSSLTPGRSPDPDWQIRGVADFNADGKPDILWHHQTSGDLYVWLMNGTAVAERGYLTPGRVADRGGQIRGVADFNADGEPDILWQHPGTGDLTAWLMKGTEVVDRVPLTPGRVADPAWRIRDVADINRDGKPDVVWHHQATGELYVWFMDGTAVSWACFLDAGRFDDPDWQVRRVADFNADGSPDILWHHQTTGQLYLWFLDGITVTGGSPPTPSGLSDVGWQIAPR